MIESNIPNLLKIKKFSEKHPSFPEGGLRHLVFHENENGLAESGAIIRNGRSVLIHEERFFNWLLSRNNKSAE